VDPLRDDREATCGADDEGNKRYLNS